MNNLDLIDKAFFLKKTPIFSRLELDLLLTIADKLHVHSLEANSPVFIQGEEGNRLYFVLTGQVEILSEDQKPLATVGPHGFFGQEALFNNLPRTYNAQTTATTDLLSLTRTNLYSIMSECPAVAIAFLSIAHQRLDCLYTQ